MDHKLPYTFHKDAYWAAEPEEIDLFADFVVVCAEGHLSPLAAAQNITDTLASEAWKNKAEIDVANKPDIDSHNGDRPYYNHIDLVAVLIGSLYLRFSSAQCSAYPTLGNDQEFSESWKEGDT